MTDKLGMNLDAWWEHETKKYAPLVKIVEIFKDEVTIIPQLCIFFYVSM